MGVPWLDMKYVMYSGWLLDFLPELNIVIFLPELNNVLS